MIERQGRTREIEGDTKGGTELVIASIAFSDGGVGIVDPGKDACFAQFHGCNTARSEGTRI